MGKGGSIYMMTNEFNTVIYIGVTSDLLSRISEHKNKKYLGSFTSRYKISKLIYYETFHDIEEAIAREKQLKGGSRKKKVALIESMNPKWEDLYDKLDW